MKYFLIVLGLGLLLVACDANETYLSNPARGDSAVSPPRSADNALQQAQLPPGAATTMLAAQWLWLFPLSGISESQTFSQVDDFHDQYRELVAYSDASNQPRRIMQVDLKTHQKVSQYTDIDSSLAGYGKNACGLVAAAAALGGEDWIPLVAVIAQAAGEHYQPALGIQPSHFVAALGQTFGAAGVRAIDGGSLGDLYRELAVGNIVIVDLKVNVQKAPSAQRPNLAHFARVLGIDVDQQVIYLENTLRGDAYWTVRLKDFWGAWQQPETSASLILDRRRAEGVTRWAVVISSELIVVQTIRIRRPAEGSSMNNSTRKVIVVFNPTAGKVDQADEVRAALASHFTAPQWATEIYETTGPADEDVAALCRAACEKGAGLVIAGGGDETLVGVASGLVHSPVPLGILPLGTGNGLARALKPSM
jgi:hypothetical protein